MTALAGATPQGGTLNPSGPKVRILYRDGAGTMHLDWPREDLETALRDADGTLWLDIEDPEDGPTRLAESILQDVFHFHPLAIEDALKETHIPKIDDWDDYVYVVFHTSAIDPWTDDLVLQELDVFLGSNYLVTYHTGAMAYLDEGRQAIERDPRDRMKDGADHLLFRFLERSVDQSLKAIEVLDVRIDDIQDQIIARPSPESLQSIFRIKRSAIHLQKTFGPQREVLNKLARDPYKPVRLEHRVYFRDVYDHIVRIHDISESLRDLIAGTLDTYLSVMSNRTNEIMKTLTLVTVMFMPMSFIVGFWGMNFFGETLAFQAPLPKALLFIASLIVMCLSPILMLNYARRHKWF
ncbi:magnesium/cobalt transporter CorA [Paludisphaera borealis]|uniref:Magnesium transport protein CorA n=1 Tax=Paludisphaera borealis TaxID=1387353 RepID=A0A1U7CN08_9BACT|nr:magnesium/cobalt transporter CorA [Paludisphaera borealis]APW60298.1 Magnesium transport protein CorA [Paludisphaera borealis]